MTKYLTINNSIIMLTLIVFSPVFLLSFISIYRMTNYFTIIMI